MRVELVDPAGPHMPAVYALRHAVFVTEQGVPVELERDELDAVCTHAVAYADDGELLGTGRLLPAGDGPAVIGRMAVRASARGTGAGAAVLARLEQAARERGDREVEVHAQLTALGFYARVGYVGHGPEYLDAGIEHQDMSKPL